MVCVGASISLYFYLRSISFDFYLRIVLLFKCVYYSFPRAITLPFGHPQLEPREVLCLFLNWNPI